jgi:hypothetical protein
MLSKRLHGGYDFASDWVILFQIDRGPEAVARTLLCLKICYIL